LRGRQKFDGNGDDENYQGSYGDVFADGEGFGLVGEGDLVVTGWYFDAAEGVVGSVNNWLMVKVTPPSPPLVRGGIAHVPAGGVGVVENQ